jgi:hypothetical protein
MKDSIEKVFSGIWIDTGLKSFKLFELRKLLSSQGFVLKMIKKNSLRIMFPNETESIKNLKSRLMVLGMRNGEFEFESLAQVVKDNDLVFNGYLIKDKNLSVFPRFPIGAIEANRLGALLISKLLDRKEHS